MTPEEKEDLKNRIFESIGAYRKRRKAWTYSAVAASLVVIAGCFYQMLTPDHILPVEYQAAATADFQGVTDVVLQLSEEEQVLIEDERSRIEYSRDDHAIKIGDSRTIKEDGAADKVNTLIVPYGKRAEVVLSDGTRVWLNSGSRLVYPSFFSGENREVFLIGEAIFDVSANAEKPFLVATNDYVVRVLGTEFNVSNYPEDASTSTVLKSGVVHIDYRGQGPFRFRKSVELAPGTRATYERNRGDLITSRVEIEPYFSWRDGVLMFRNDRLVDIVKRLSRYYDVEVDIASDELKQERFSGHLNLQEDILQVIEVINESAGQVFNIESAEDGKRIKLTKT